MNSQYISGHFLGLRSWRVVESLMCGRKSVVFIQSSWILGGELDGLEGSNWGSWSDAWVITRDWYSYHTSLTTRLWEIVTCSDPREQRSSCAPRGIPLAKPTWVWFACELANPGDISGNLPHMRSTLPVKWAASSGSEVQGSSGTCRIYSSSSGFGVGKEEQMQKQEPQDPSQQHLTSPCPGDHLLQGWGQDIGRASAPVDIVLPGAFLIGPHSSEEPQLGWLFLPSLFPASCGFHGNTSREGISSTPILPDRVGWSISHPSLAVQWETRRPWIVARPVFGLGSNWGAGVGIKTLSTIQAPCSSAISRHRPTCQHWSCTLWSLGGTPLHAGKGGDLVGKKGVGERLQERQFALQDVPPRWSLVVLGQFNSTFNSIFNFAQESAFLLWCRGGSAFLSSGS